MGLKMGRTGDEEFPAHVKSLTIGLPKSGKTTFASTFPNVVFLVLESEFQEGGLQSVAHKDVPYVRITSRQDYQTAKMVLRDDSLRAKMAHSFGLDEIETVALDTVDRYQQMLKAERAGEKSNAFSGRDARDDWNWLLETMREDIGALTALELNVIILCHSKQQTLEENLTVEAPLLQGQFADDIPGMVGYSMAALKRRKVDAQGNSSTEYVLQTEGDETQPYIGNRAAGRLEKFIPQEYGHLYKAVYANLQIGKSKRAELAGDGASEPAKGGETPVQTSDVSEPVTDGQTADGQVSVQDAQPAPSGAPKADDEEPITTAAQGHVEKAYEELGLVPPSDLGEWTMGRARDIVGLIRSCKKDVVAGELAEDELMPTVVGLLQGKDAYVAPDSAEATERLPKDTQSVDEWLEWVGGEVTRAKRALEHEEANKGRKTLLRPLRDMLGIDDPEEADEAPPEAAEGTPSEPSEPAASEPEQEAGEVTPPAEADDTGTTSSDVDAQVAEASALVEETLDATKLTEEEQWKALPENQRPCEHGGYLSGCERTAENSKDDFDLDIARLSVTRFQKWFCIPHYVEHMNQGK